MRPDDDVKPKSALCRFGRRGARRHRRDATHYPAAKQRRRLRSPSGPPWISIAARAGHPAQLRLDRSPLAGRGHRPRRLPRGAAGPDEHEGRRGDRRGVEVRAPRPRRRRLPHRPEMANRPAGRVGRQVRHLQRRRRRSRRVHGPQRAGRRSARDDRGHAHRLATPSAPTKDTSTSAASIRWPYRPSRTPSARPRSAACWATTSSAAATRCGSRSAAGRGRSSAAKRRR